MASGAECPRTLKGWKTYCGAKPLRVLNKRYPRDLREFPAEMFEQVLWALVVQLKRRFLTRRHRPLPPSIAWTQQRFKHIWIVDGSTLEALFRKLKSLQDQPITKKGKIYTRSRSGQSEAGRHPL